MKRLVQFAIVAAIMLGQPASASGRQDAKADWPTYGGDEGGQRFSLAKQIDRSNVQRLHPIWTYHTHALDARRAGSSSAMFEATPILFRGLLYLSTPFNEIIAVDPTSGKERWRFQPSLGPLREGDLITSRGVASWSGSDSNKICENRIFEGTNDAQLVSVDALSGRPCIDFGHYGKVDLREGLSNNDRRFHVTSAPTVVGNVVIVGSSVPDNQETNAARGTLRAYDTRTGKPVWTWEPLSPLREAGTSTGAGNAWSTISADSSMGLIFVPTGSASPDYYGGMRLGDDRDADSVVALCAATGQKVWAFQVVHHDLWDYDVAGEPLLFAWHGDTPAVAVTTKMGMIFVLDRKTGMPLIPVIERAVPRTDVKGEVVSSTQPFSTLPALSPLTFETSQSVFRSADENKFCKEQIAHLRYEGAYTPPSVEGSLVFPGSLGGVNWGSAAYDPFTGVLFANVNRLPYAVRLVRANGLKETYERFRTTGYRTLHLLLTLTTMMIGLFALILKKARSGWMRLIFCAMAIATAFSWYNTRNVRTLELRHSIDSAFGHDYSPQKGAPYGVYRYPILDHSGMPCTAEPWGTVTAVDLQTGKILWQKPHGALTSTGETGLTSLGGVIVTAGGLVFSAGTREPLIRAYDSSSGRELWRGDLPFPAQSTPMTYEIAGRQYVVIAAGGHGLWGTKTGDALVAFSVD